MADKFKQTGKPDDQRQAVQQAASLVRDVYCHLES